MELLQVTWLVVKIHYRHLQRLALKRLHKMTSVTATPPSPIIAAATSVKQQPPARPTPFLSFFTPMAADYF
jgi:hypothetical protein